MKIYLGEVKFGKTEINFNGLVQVNIKRSVFGVSALILFEGGLIFKRNFFEGRPYF